MLANMGALSRTQVRELLGLPETEPWRMTEEDAFLAELDSGDLSCLAVFADWLEDNDQPGRAAFCRRESALPRGKLTIDLTPYEREATPWDCCWAPWAHAVAFGDVVRLETPQDRWRKITAVAGLLRVRVGWRSGLGGMEHGVVADVVWRGEVVFHRMKVRRILNHTDWGYVVEMEFA